MNSKFEFNFLPDKDSCTKMKRSQEFVVYLNFDENSHLIVFEHVGQNQDAFCTELMMDYVLHFLAFQQIVHIF